MDSYTVFTCIGSITPEIQKICTDKNIHIFSANIEHNERYDTLNDISKELINHKTLFITNAECYITKKMQFILIGELENRLRTLTQWINSKVIIDKESYEYRNENKQYLTNITSSFTSELSLTEFSTKSLNQIFKEYNYEDMKRIKAIESCFYDYGIQDVLPKIYDELQIIKQKEYKSKHINSWKIDFDNSFDNMDENQKYKLLRNIEEKYHDFNDIILRTSNKMKSSFQESGKSKLYDSKIPNYLHLKHMTKADGKLRFKIIVEEEGKKSTYYESAGGFFVLWNE